MRNWPRCEVGRYSASRSKGTLGEERQIWTERMREREGKVVRHIMPERERKWIAVTAIAVVEAAGVGVIINRNNRDFT